MHPVFVQDFDSIIAASAERLKKLAGSTVLITGACGFIGSYLVDFLAYCNDNFFSEGCHVIGEDNFAVADGDRLGHLGGRADVELFTRDISQWPPNRGLPPIDWIIHCASIASPAIYRTMPIETMRVNAIGTWKILELAETMGVKGFLQMSSSEVYGDASIIPTPETCVGAIQPLGNRSCYDVSKLFGETLCYLFHQERGVKVKIARPFNVYGPGAVNDGRIIPELMAAVVEDREFTVHGDGTATRSYCYVSDAVVQLLAILVGGVPGEAYNVGSHDDDLSITKIVEIAQQIFDGKPKVRIDSNSALTKDAPRRRKPHVGKAFALLERYPEPCVFLRDGLRRVYESMK